MKWQPDIEFLRHALIVVAGHRYYLLPLAPLLWLAFHGVRIMLDPSEAITGSGVQGQLIAVPLTALAVFFGMRIIAGEINDRTLEIAYTIPGGVERLWFAKLGAALLLLVVTEILLAIAVLIFFTTFPPGALYGALQAAVFHMILAMSLGALFKSEASGAIVTLGILALEGLITDFGASQLRFHPFFNPYVLADIAANSGNVRSGGFTSPEELLAWTIQNRIAMFLAMSAILALAFFRSNRREKMLDGM